MKEKRKRKDGNVPCRKNIPIAAVRLISVRKLKHNA